MTFKFNFQEYHEKKAGPKIVEEFDSEMNSEENIMLADSSEQLEQSDNVQKDENKILTTKNLSDIYNK